MRTGLGIFLAVILLLAAITTGVATSAYAEPSEFAGGVGSAENPYQIENADQLNNVRKNLSAFYKITKDIDLSGYSGGSGWDPIGTISSTFNGELDGDGHTITGLTINRPGAGGQGLFGHTGSTSVIKNVRLNGVAVEGHNNVGGLAGGNQGTISNSYSVGNVKGVSYVGGLVGQNQSSIINSHSVSDVSGWSEVGGVAGTNQGSIKNSSSSGDVMSLPYAYESYFGGLVGTNKAEGTITSSYSKGTVTGTYEQSLVGGLVGRNIGTITNAYSIGNISSGRIVGGLVGTNFPGKIVTNTYAVGVISGSSTGTGGIVGSASTNDFIKSYYDNGKTIQNPTNTIGTGKTSAEMQLQSTYQNWDFDTVWGIDPSKNAGLPYLRAMQKYVLYDGNENTGGVTPIDNNAYKSGDTFTVASNTGNLEKMGYTFEGWNTKADGTGDSLEIGSSFVIGSSDIKLYAQWSINSYTVTFNKNGGDTEANPKSITVAYGSNIGTLPTAPSKAVYTFAGWNTAADGKGSSFTAATVVTGNMTVYAQWAVNNYTVTFDKNGGDTEANPASIAVDHGENVGALPDVPTKAGSTFAGWNTAADGKGTAFTAATVVTGDITVYAQWSINSYTVTFDRNEGDTEANPTSITVVYGGNIGTLPTAPGKAGYTFAGWNTAADGRGSSFTAATVVTGSMTVYAQWAVNSYAVTFDKNGGDTEANPASIAVDHGENVGALPDVPTKAGSTFAGWNTAADGKGTAFTAATVVTGDITVYAQWSINSYTVTFDRNEGDAEANPTSITVAYGGNIGTLPTAPSKIGYTFAGWNTAADGKGSSFTAATVVTEDITVYAQWSINSYMVTFDSNEGDTEANPTSVAVDHGENVGVLPDVPTKAGFTFVGWNTAADGKGSSFTAATVVTGNITVYAQWSINSYTVTFDSNEGDEEANPTSVAVDHGENVGVLPDVPTKAGFTFVGWNTTADGKGSSFTAATVVTGNITVYAQWAVNSYAVTFDRNEGDTEANPTSITVAYGGNIGTLPTAPSKAGYTFVGWNTAVDGKGSPFTAATVVTDNMTVYAQWSINSYTVTFDKNGGDTEANPASVAVDHGKNVGALPDVPTKAGSTFTGWNTAADGKGSSFTAATVVTGDITVYAQWSINSYTVAFDSNEGDTEANPASVAVDHGENVGALPDVPTKAGSTFAGWNTAADGKGSSFTATTVVTGDITVYAQWSINSYTVAFDSNEGDTEANPTSITVAYGVNIGALPTAPSKVGYTFAGWNTAADGKGSSFTAAAVVTGDITVYAQWSINSYTVAFDSNEGDTEANPASVAVDHGENVGALPDVPTKAGSTFVGWNTAADGKGNLFTAATVVTGNMTVYAQWAVNSYAVTFDSNDGDTEANPTSITVAYGGNIGALPTAPSKVGYTFAGWNTAADGKGSSFTAAAVVTGDITVYAQWSINSYTVTFDSNEGDTEANPTSITVAYGGNIGTLPTEPSKIGYTFAGWNTAADGKGSSFTAATVVTGDITVYAQWSINSYTVTFDSNEGDAEANPTSITVAYGGNIGTLPTAPSKVGYTFVGWNTAADGKGSSFTAATVVTGNMTVYAQWAVNSYAVTFDSNDGDTEANPTSITVAYGVNIGALPTAPSKVGYTFLGWNTAADGKGNSFTAATVVTEDITVYAQWSVNSYTVTFDKNGGDTEANPASVAVDHGENVGALPDVPTKAGYTFAGWNTAADGKGSPFTAATVVTGDITVYAQWGINSYTVTFDSNEGDTEANPASVTVDHGENVGALPDVPTKVGYTFTGWNTAADGKGSSFTEATMVTDNMTLYAQWSINSYTVTFDSNEGDTEASPTSITVAYGGNIGILPIAPSKAGYTFAGWNTAADGKGSPFTAATVVTDNMTVHAQWSINSYTVAFDSNEGDAEANPTSITVAYGSNIDTLPTAPSKVGYTFLGWNTAADGKGNSFTAATVVTGDITVYAQWSINSYTVTFDKNGGDTEANPASVAVDHGENVGALPDVPTKAGYTFAGWNTTADGKGTAFTAATVVTGDITVYAQWSINSYTVTFDKNGGDTEANPTSITVAYGGNIGALPTVPSKVGYTFAGWNTAADGKGSAFTAATVVTGDITVYAQWGINSYTVTFDSNEGDTEANPASVTVDHGENVGALPDVPTKVGYTFTGWNTAADGKGSSFTKATMVTGNMTVHAQWGINSYTVAFDSNEGDEEANPTSITVAYGVNIGTLPTEPSKTGYTFAGWNTAADGKGSPFTAATVVTDNMTVYAQWSINSYTVTFDSNEGDTEANPTSITAAYGGNVGALPIPPIRMGYTFAGWNTDANGNGDSFNAATAVTAEITLYAQWTADPIYTVTYNGNKNTGGSVPSDNNHYLQGATVTVLGNTGSLTRSGYTFVGWNAQEDGMGTDYAAGSTLMMGTDDVTLYAQWRTNDSGSSSGDDSPVSTVSCDTTFISTNGKLTLPACMAGKVSLGEAITVTIPAGTFDKELTLTIEKVLDSQQPFTDKDMLVSPIYEILKNFSGNFKKSVTLIFAFDPSSLKENQVPVVFYYDEAKKEWVEIGGIVNGDKITIGVDHFTKFAVFAVGQADTPTTDNPTEEQAPDVTFIDISGHWAEASIKQAVKNGIANGYTDGTFKPNRKVSRAEFVVMLMNALKPQGAGAELPFTDTAKIGAWAKKAVAQAVQAGIISGYEDGSFRPDAEITRAEMAKMIANALKLPIESDAATGFADDKDIPAWAKGAVAAIKSLGIVKGKGANKFDPNAKTTRAEAVTVLLKVLEHWSK